MTRDLEVELHEMLSEAYPHADQIDIEVDGDWAHVTIHLTPTWRIRRDVSWHGPVFGFLFA